MITIGSGFGLVMQLQGTLVDGIGSNRWLGCVWLLVWLRTFSFPIHGHRRSSLFGYSLLYRRTILRSVEYGAKTHMFASRLVTAMEFWTTSVSTAVTWDGLAFLFLFFSFLLFLLSFLATRLLECLSSSQCPLCF